jgi:hypothetical protein
MITMDTEAAAAAELLAVGGGNRDALGRDGNNGKGSGCGGRNRE